MPFCQTLFYYFSPSPSFVYMLVNTKGTNTKNILEFIFLAIVVSSYIRLFSDANSLDIKVSSEEMLRLQLASKNHHDTTFSSLIYMFIHFKGQF